MSALEVGAELPGWSTRVDGGHMKVFSLITRDPNPIHWSVDDVRSLGLGDRVVNQGGLNVAYVVAALGSWPGIPLRVRSLNVRFRGNVVEGDTAQVRATVTALRSDEADLDVRLVAGAEEAIALSGTATVRILIAENIT